MARHHPLCSFTWELRVVCASLLSDAPFSQCNVDFDSLLYMVTTPSLPPLSLAHPSSLFPFNLFSCSPSTQHTHTHIHTIQLIEALESFVSGTRTRLRKMMMKKREKESLTYVNVKPRNASMAVEVSGTNSFSTTYCELHTAFE